MITPDKTYTDNPFVDNVIYYAKIMAMNAVVKDEDEALANETAESLAAGDVYIACIEGWATYNMFTSIPKEILENYITSQSNLDLYANNNNTLKAYLNSLTKIQRTQLYNNLSALARTIYVDHYEIMMNYLDGLSDTWMEDHEALYNACVNGTATYLDLFDEIPEYTRWRVIKYYLNNYDASDLDGFAADLDTFKAYIATRSDDSITTELEYISYAMRLIFKSHYEMMIERGYINEYSTTWDEFVTDTETYDKCKDGTATYADLYIAFPYEELEEALYACLGEDLINSYGLLDGVDVLTNYFDNISSDPATEIATLTTYLTEVYIRNYNPYINADIYVRCLTNKIEYYELTEYIPFETLKIILNAYIEEVTNLEVYENSKSMLDSYLATLSAADRKAIQEGITAEMIVWYPEHHVETNNYYRALIGLPPMGEDGTIYVDTLVHSYDATSDSYLEFGTEFTSQIVSTTYPDSHWRQELYLFDSYDIGMLSENNILENYVAACGSTMDSARYKYLKFLGDEKLDLYTCRKAYNFQLIGIPTLDDTDAQKKYVDTYAVNRDYVIRTVYSDAYKFQSDYYNKFMIIFIIINTIMDMLTGIPELIIHREIFDSRCIKYLFESYGIPYYSEIPIKYQRAMLKNLNILIKYKSSTRNMVDICNLFGFSDVKVFNYYMFKQRNVDANSGEYLFDDGGQVSYDLSMFYVMDANGAYTNYNGVHFIKMLDYQKYDEDTYTHLVYYTDEDGNTQSKRVINQDADVYIYDEENNDFIPLADVDYFTKVKANTDEATIVFVKVPTDESFIDYKSDANYIIPYDEIVYQDEGDTWDGGLDHDKLYQDILDYEFNAVITKYISVETVTEMTELAFQVAYFYNMLFDNIYSEEALTVLIPHIKIGHEFKFMDVLCYLFALMYLYNGMEDNIMYSPTQILYVKGYNFDEALDQALQDSRCFQQTDEETGEALEDYEKYNIFDVNERIAEDGYSYQDAFAPFRIRSFNLNADIDAIEKFLNDEFQLSLDDFIVDDTLTTFNTVITLRNFYSLNNSYYQKSIFKDGIVPIQYNQNIKYAYDYELYEVEVIYDADGTAHRYVTEGTYYMEVINSTSDTIYVLDYINYINMGETNIYAVYTQYTKNTEGNFVKSSYIPYIVDEDTQEYTPLFTGSSAIIDTSGRYVFAADAYYEMDEDGNYVEITDEQFFSEDVNGEFDSILNFGQYYIYVDGNWILDPTNTYVRVTKGTTIELYVLATDTGDYTNLMLTEDSIYVLHSDGHFVCLADTDYYTRDGNEDDDSSGFEYNEEECYVITDEETEYYDPSVSPRVYYQKLSDYYSANNWIVYADQYYVKDGNGNYIPVEQVMSPNNTYYLSESGYRLVIDDIGIYYQYDEPLNVDYILVLQSDNSYERYILSDLEYVASPDDVNWYVLNSDLDYVTVLLTDATYVETATLIVVFNKAVSNPTSLEDEENGKYDPEKTDELWDENDWFYTAESSDGDNILSMNGENKWYYKKGDVTQDDTETDTEPVGSGWYMTSTAYIGDVTLEEGEKYYMAFDVETNFTGEIQIYCTADSSVEATTDRVYGVTYGEATHVSQIFIANSDSTPEVRFLIYSYEEYPIEVGDYIVMKNMRFVKAYSENFIAQDIPSYDKLQELYRTNEAIYNYLADLLANCSDYYEYRIYKYLYDSLMVSKYNKEAFKTGENTYATTYTEYLRSRDAVLYERMVYYKTLDEDTMHKEVADDIIEVTYAIDDCVDTYSYGYLYSYFPAVSASYIQEYITKIINFFKSWKVHLLGINTVYKFDDPLENTIRALEGQQYRNRYDHVKGTVHVHDTVKINPMDDVNCSGIAYTDLYPDLETITNAYRDRVRVRDRVRIISKEENMIKFDDEENNIHIILNNDEPVVKASEDGILTITSSEAGFATENDNEFVMTTDETEEDVFASQVLNEINLHSNDFYSSED